MVLEVTSFYVLSKWPEGVTVDSLVSHLELPEYLFTDDGSLDDLLLYQDAAQDSQAHDGTGTIQFPCPVQVSAPPSTPSTVAPSMAINAPAAPANISKAPVPPIVANQPGSDGQMPTPTAPEQGEELPARLNKEAENSQG